MGAEAAAYVVINTPVIDQDDYAAPDELADAHRGAVAEARKDALATLKAAAADDTDVLDVSYRYEITGETKAGNDIESLAHDDERVVLAILVTAEDVAEATTRAMDLAASVDGNVAELFVRSDNDFDGPVNTLAGVSELADVRGFRKQYASTVSQKDGFVLPEGVISAGPVWLLHDIVRWAKENPGRSSSNRRRRR